jgi:hypothetical protein
MSAAHTPGPWVYFYKHKYDEHHVSVPAPGRSFKLALFDNGCQSENAEADARLIAAAPDLMDALKALLSLDDDHQRGSGDEDVCQEVRMARAAIAKATGATS